MEFIMQKHILRNALTLLLAFFFFTGFLSADNWHRWRGPNNDGISQATDAPIHWSQTENVRWRLPLPGEAASTPVVWEDKIFLTSAEGDALVLMCVSTEGEELWKRTIGRGNRSVRRGEGNFAALLLRQLMVSAHVWAFFGGGSVSGYDVKGMRYGTPILLSIRRFNLFFVMASTPLL